MTLDGSVDETGTGVFTSVDWRGGVFGVERWFCVRDAEALVELDMCFSKICTMLCACPILRFREFRCGAYGS